MVLCWIRTLLCLLWLVQLGYAEVETEDEDYVPRFFGGRRNGENAGVLPIRKTANTRSATINVTTTFFDQKLDHFDPYEVRKWKQRYMIYDQYYKPFKKGPIFIVIGGEWNMTTDQVSSGQVDKLAQKYNALILGLEHRFYGMSRPRNNTSVGNLKYLSIRQALGDLSNFVRSVSGIYAWGKRTRKVVLFGCSYAGTLAAFHRSKYPELTAGAIANSAPLEARENFDSYWRLFFSHMNHRAHPCGNVYMDAMDEFDKVIKGKNQTRLTELFKLCPPGELDFTNEDAVAAFSYDMTTTLTLAVQGDKPRQGPMSDLGRFCNKMIDSSYGTALDRYAVWLRLEDNTCLLNQGKPFAAKNISWNSKHVARGSRQWFYQMCTEFGFFTSNSLNLAGPMIHLDYLEKTCSESFGITDIASGIQATNRRYGGVNWNGTNVYFLVGMVDPWAVVSLNRPVPNRTVQKRLVSSMSHCGEPWNTEMDRGGMNEAWGAVDESIVKWIS